MIAEAVMALGLLLLAAFGVLVGAAVGAPEGYEDASGFHECAGPRPMSAREAMVLDATLLETGALKTAMLVSANRCASDHAHGTP